MSSVVEQYVGQEVGKAEAKAETRAHAALLEIARRLFQTGKDTPEEIAEMLGLSVGEVIAVCG